MWRYQNHSFYCWWVNCWIFSLGVLYTVVLWIFLYRSFLLDTYLQVELLSHGISVYSVLVDIAKLFFNIIITIYTSDKSSQFSSVHLLSHVDSLWPHELQHARPPCPSPTPGIYSNSCVPYSPQSLIIFFLPCNHLVTTHIVTMVTMRYEAISHGLMNIPND